MSLALKSPAFKAGGRIPVRYTGDGEDVSPPLTWSKPPGGARALALLCDDPDAPRDEPWVHWVMTDIPADAAGLPEGISKEARPREVQGAAQGKNDFGRLGYGGPAPPRGHGTHHYRFKLFALDAPLKLPGTPTKEALLRAVAGHELDSAELVGLYSR
jgi:Raf kinase inhibitor-like YbhB/YbcL family protein